MTGHKQQMALWMTFILVMREQTKLGVLFRCFDQQLCSLLKLMTCCRPSVAPTWLHNNRPITLPSSGAGPKSLRMSFTHKSHAFRILIAKQLAQVSASCRRYGRATPYPLGVPIQYPRYIHVLALHVAVLSSGFHRNRCLNS